MKQGHFSAWARRALHGFIQLALYVIGGLPSHRLRKALFRASRMKIGHNTFIYLGAEVRAPWRIAIGEGTSIGTDVVLDGRGHLTIGNRVNLSSEVMIWTMQHDYRTRDFCAIAAPVVIEDYVWLGPRVIVLPGVVVAKGCVIAAGAVVTRNTEPFGVYGGVPAKRIGERRTDIDYAPGENHTPFI